ncbi:MAG: helix-turn-helix domain-containing protein [Stenomitos rutilans HA7619-LM2]|jgi:transposase-like protein|nr:helix-turn-helix domain-containing protein [Stenomitos rutilans HA7619-LM2]
MTSRKLSESDKQEILQLYRQPGETTSTLASRYGVSNSTISRILKQSFSEAEYDILIQQKRGNRTSTEATSSLTSDSEAFAPETSKTLNEPAPQTISTLHEALGPEVMEVAPSPVNLKEPFDAKTVVVEAPTEPLPHQPQVETSSEPLSVTANGRRLRKRSSAPPEASPSTTFIAPPIVKSKSLDSVEQLPIEPLGDEASPSDAAGEAYLDPTYDDRDAVFATPSKTAEAITGEDLLPEAELASDLENDEEDDLDDDGLDDDDLDEDDLDDDLEDEALLVGSRIAGKALVQVLPLAEAALPRTCYLVVDRSAELIARPLKEFGDLGQIPEAEILEKTLPIFDNHRVAKRYSNPRTQRVIKLPDAQVLQKTSSHLQAKGITRLLIDGQVYAL